METESSALPCRRLEGILFSRSVRSSFATLLLAPIHEAESSSGTHSCDGLADTDEDPVLVRIQFCAESLTPLRSYCRRLKLGDILAIRGGVLEEVSDDVQTEWSMPRLVIDVESEEAASSTIVTIRKNAWSSFQCQVWQKRFSSKPKDESSNASSTIESKASKVAICDDHGGGEGKRIRAEKVANFLLHMMMSKLAKENNIDGDLGHPAEWSQPPGGRHFGLRVKAIEMLNSGSGVADVAGGSGHVSMALSLLGVKSTVVDPRLRVGKLPGRDRKYYNKQLKKMNKTLHETSSQDYCPPVVPYRTARAWIGPPPEGVEVGFREQTGRTELGEVPVYDENSSMLRNASAIIALHPDEATGVAVELAVRLKIPMLVVPCCVFCRLFPNRKKPGTEEVVSTYDDLLAFLTGIDPSIKKTKLSFPGKSTVLWATF